MFWRGKNKFSHLEMVGRKKLIGFGGLGLGSPQGNTYYVDPYATNTGDDNEGTDADYPLTTMDAAFDLCTTENDDYIIVLDCWSSGEPIEVDKSRVHVIGLNNPQAPWNCLNAGADTPIFVCAATGNHSEIAGFNLGGGSGHACIEMGDATGMWYHNNAFGHEYSSDTPLYGLINANTDVHQNPAFALIEDNIFFGDGNNAKGKITSNGIYCTGANVNNWIVRNNTFMGLVGASVAGAIYISGGHGFMIYDNLFMVTDVSGSAIDIVTTSTGSIISGNRAAYGFLNTGYANNPFRDTNANTVNAWSMNYRGNSVIEPVGV